MKKKRSFLKWAGSKYNCLDHLLGSFPQTKRLIEPFTGSGSILMNTDYPLYFLAEKNPDLILLFNYLQQEGQRFINYCQSFFSTENNSSEQYYNFRFEFNQTGIKPRRRAALFLYLNRHGYNGLCRYNSTGGYNVPFGRYTRPYFPMQEMIEFYQRSQRATFHLSDYTETFKQAKGGDFIYCDPPYVPLKQHNHFSAYTRVKFNEKDQIKLAQLARETAAKGATVIISNHDVEFTRELYQGAEIKSFPVSRFINCDTHNRIPARELIAVFK